LQRLENDPIDEIDRSRGLKIPRRFGQKLRQTLLHALADQQVRDVKNAIERLDEGVYGVCVVCGGKIAPDRLEAIPTATHCWDCQPEKSK